MRSLRAGPLAPVVLSLAVLVVLVLGACSSLPEEGPVRAATSTDPSSTSAPFDFNPPGPRSGASPEEVVAGFLNALQATPVTTRVAEEFLTARAVTDWRPARRTVVYGSERVVPVAGDRADEGPRDGQARVELRLADVDVLDATGRWRSGPSTPGARRLTLRLEREQGGWRLANPPDAVVVPQSHFASRYRQYSLFFFDPTASTLVPEPVYLPWGVQAPTLLVEGLLRGPAAGPRAGGASGGPSVARTFLPPGTRLGVGVPVVDGVAEVPLSEEVYSLEGEDLDLALAQVAWTLRQVPEIGRLRLVVDGDPFELPDGALDASVRGWDAYSPVLTWASTDVFGLRRGEVRQVRQEEEEITAASLVGLGASFARARSLGVDMVGQQFALVAQDGARVGVVTRAEGAGAAEVLPTTDPLRPMWDRAGLLWVVDRTAAGAQVLVRRKGSLTELRAPGLTGGRLVAAALSRDGSRLAAVRRTSRGAEVVVARVLRTAGGTPVRLTPARRVPTGAQLARPVSVGWWDPTTVAVLTRPAPRLSRVVLLASDGATTLPWPRGSVDDFPGRVRTLVASPGGPTALLLWDARGRLHGLDPQGSWDLDVFREGLRTPTFVG